MATTIRGKAGREPRRKPGDRLGKWLATTVAAIIIAGVGLAFINGPASATPSPDLHCPTPYLKKVEGNYNTKVLRKGTVFCVKASDGNTGRLTADGTHTLRWYVRTSGLRNNGGNVPDVSYFVIYERPPVKKTILRYGGRILGPCGDPWYTARIWNGSKSTRPVTIILEVRNGRTLWKRTLQPGQSMKPRATWLPGGKVLILRRGNGDVIDRERTVTGTFSWSECRNG